ncbi:hypothetical protein FRX31_017423 [Thalictrum thalictroides]|uniref:Uncharacterized protein n=1 Tax=Thalictrum thalictroides TaxID=46969 RepID=A0A7J6W6J6_THATH|nr:hypothetical protein FRX31_017423 [Thalictrum thalictroides]
MKTACSNRLPSKFIAGCNFLHYRNYVWQQLNKYMPSLHEEDEEVPSIMQSCRFYYTWKDDDSLMDIWCMSSFI